MSVVKMIIADDRRYLCGELHGSRSQWVYAACSRSPGSLDELDRLLPEFGAAERLQNLFGQTSALDLAPVDAGLIIIDLAKKWIYAENTYFSAHRRGRYQLRDGEDALITYEFSDKWQFVAEAKWFKYLWSCDLHPYGDLEMPASEIAASTAHTHPAHQDQIPRCDQEIAWDEFAPMLEPAPDDFSYEDDGEEIWDDERAGIEVELTNRWTGLIDFEPRNAEEERDLQTLEHIIRYDQNTAVARYQIQQARKAIAGLQIELQAAENLWNRKAEPRWGLKRIHIQARIEQQEKHIFHLTDVQNEADAMAAELRTLGTTEKFQETLKLWRDEGRNTGSGSEVPL